MTKFNPPSDPGTLAIPLLLTALVAPAHALQVNASVQDLGSSFQYSFSVVNDDPIDDLFIVTLTDAPIGDALIAGSLSSPTGFDTNYDAGLGLLDLIADSALSFPAGATEFFSFESSAAPTAAFTSYEALDIFFTSYTGSVDAQLSSAAVPLPPAIALFALGFGVFFNRMRRNGQEQFLTPALPAH